MGGASFRNDLRIPGGFGQNNLGPNQLLLIHFDREIMLSVRVGEHLRGQGEILVGFTADDFLAGSVRCLGIRFRGRRVLGSFDLLRVSSAARFSGSFGRVDGSTDATFLLDDTVSALFPAAGLKELDIGRLYPFKVRDGRLTGESLGFARLGVER